MYTCVLVDGIVYFVNLTILRKAGIFKKHVSTDGGVIESVPVVRDISNAIDNVAYNIEQMTNSDFLDALKLVSVELIMKTALASKAILWSGAQLGNTTSYLDARNYQMKLLSGDQINKILLNTLGMSILDFLIGEKQSLKRVSKRIIAQLPIEYEKQLVGYKCPCNKAGGCPA
jgi:hypothetical protein